MTWLNQTQTTIHDQPILVNPRPNNPTPELLIDKPHGPGPPHENILTNYPTPTHLTHIYWPIINEQGKTAHATSTSPNPHFMQIQSFPLSSKHTPPIISFPEITPTSTKPTTRKRLRKEFGRFGRNIRQRLFCGLFSRELTGKQGVLDDESILGLADTSNPTVVAPTPQDPTCDEGLWEANPNQLPEEP
jgi:hypothetical protein